jgi:glyoxylase-like metal-dependent hydrolase (beta-lactamase superfamily II)
VEAVPMQPSFVQRHRFERIGRIPTPTPFAVGDINTYLILPEPGSEELVLVDTGVKSDAAWAALTGGLKEFGFGPADVTLVILTHAHPDHCGQAARVRREAGCEVWIHEDAGETLARYGGDPEPSRADRVAREYARWGVERELSTGSTAPPGAHDIVEPFEPDRWFRDGDRVEISGFDLDVVHTPGHCPEQVVFWQADARQMLSGDHLLPDITPVSLLHLPEADDALRSRTMVQFLESLGRAEQLPARRAFPSHGDVIHDHRALIASYRLHHQKRMLQVARLLRDGELTPAEIGRRMFRRVWREQVYLVLSEVIGHLDLLEAEGHVEPFERDGVVRYRLLSEPNPAQEAKA